MSPPENRLRKAENLAPDWAKMIEELSNRIPVKHIARVMGLTILSESMLRSYRNGVQPMYWRGEALVVFWCETMNRTREQLPMIPVQRGHRSARRQSDTSPKVVNLPEWPPAPQASVKPIKRRVAA